MDKLEKVISGIKACKNNIPGRCEKCPYRGKDTHDCVGELLNDALDHLKKRNGLVMSLKQSNSVNEYLNQQIEVLENQLKGKKKKGHWSNISTVKGETYKRCSCCFYVCNGWDIETGVEYYFCPNCGADMREDGEKK